MNAPESANAEAANAEAANGEAANTNEPGDDAPSQRAFVVAIWLAIAIAMAASAYLLRSFLLKTYGVDAFDSACSINETFNCDKINTSIWGKIGGVPITIFALPTYAAFAVLATFGRRADAMGRGALRLLAVGAGMGLAYGMFLLYVMVAIEETYCLFCLTMDACALAILLFARFAAQRAGPGPVRFGKPLAFAVAVGVVVLASAWTYHSSLRATLLTEQIAVADAAEAEANSARTAIAAAADAAATTATTATTATAATTPGAARKLSDSLYDIPVDAEDASVGPVDAAVTIIEYADFQCGYCKKLFYALTNVKRRYSDRVRFVFKHFPMNTLCNAHIKNNRHKYACNAALASECARRQGKFWEMHDMLFKNQHKLESEDLRYYATDVGLDVEAYSRCMREPAARTSLKRAIDEGASIGISATPRTFINGLMLSGALPEELLATFIDRALAKAAGTVAPEQAAAEVVAPPAPSVAAGMVRVATAKGAFFIDRYEAAVDDKGLALSAPGVIPANASWYEAKEACEKAGKRMCTSFEWVSACAGKDAVDNDSNGNFADDYVEGNQFPYADYNEPGYCHVDGDRREGRPQETGKSPRCVTPSGIYDLAGNVEEWIENDEGTAQLAGGDFRVGDKGSCVRAHRSFGAGHRSHGIGFRCCADRDVANSGSPAVLSVVPDSIVGEKAPKFSLKGADGGAVSEAILKGKVTFLTFFASWCGPCQRELPELAAMQVELAAKGVQIIAVGVDTDEADSRTFVAGLGPLPLTFVYDPNSRALGRFDVANMPTGYLIDRGGVIRHKQIGFGEKTRAELEAAIADLLK